ncbi:WecB/TagA/CpsF family glycosyltransferase [Vagococcus sp.]|uniref:WecB/TagA/CpsF family glycosyltransferase n=1 Tax=Vagococcus sp. TaxID=1933889 RepID=UPI003F9B07F7
MTKSVEKIYNTTVDCLTLADITADFSSYFNTGKKMTLTSVNPQIILMSEENPMVKAFIEQSTHRFADGIGVVKLSQWTNGKIKERVAGIDVMVEALKYANQQSKRIFLYGAQPEVVKQAAVKISETYPHLTVAGYIDGYTQLTEAEVVHQINESQTDMLFVALGSPRQEEWLAKHVSELKGTVFQTVGGSLDVLSGSVRRAPDFFIKTNLEWVYRSFSHPTRFYRMVQIPIFVGKSLLWHIKNKTQTKES